MIFFFFSLFSKGRKINLLRMVDNNFYKVLAQIFLCSPVRRWHLNVEQGKQMLSSKHRIWSFYHLSVKKKKKTYPVWCFRNFFVFQGEVRVQKIWFVSYFRIVDKGLMYFWCWIEVLTNNLMSSKKWLITL